LKESGVATIGTVEVAASGTIERAGAMEKATAALASLAKTTNMIICKGTREFFGGPPPVSGRG
jgi:hypothetical protein